jgi:hypothetical protein
MWRSLAIHHRQGFVIAASVKPIYKLLLNELKDFTCNGATVSSIANCISDGALCSDVGTCNSDTGTCICPDGREGQYCERDTSSSSSLALPIALGTTPHTHTRTRMCH